jgi:hypothetical protein
MTATAAVRPSVRFVVVVRADRKNRPHNNNNNKTVN